MKYAKLGAFALVMMVLGALLAVGLIRPGTAHTDSGDDLVVYEPIHMPRPDPEPEPEPEPVAILADEHPLAALPDAILVGETYRYRNLTLITLRGGGQSAGFSILTLDQALERGVLKVAEKGGGQVNSLIIENTGKVPVFIMAGEVLSGGRQDRVSQHDLLVPAHSGPLAMDAFCVEHGRWHGSTSTFQSEGNLVNIGVRQRASETGEQSAVWSGVDSTIAQADRAARAAAPAAGGGSAGIQAPTSAIQDTYRSESLRRTIDPYVEALRNLPNRDSRIRGVVVGIGDRVLAVDLFSDHDLFKALWPKLLRSYALEAVARYDESGSISQGEAREMLKLIPETRWHENDNIGMGRLITMESGDLTGSALINSRHVIHMEAFPRVSIDSGPVHSSTPPPLQRSYPPDY